MNLPPPLLPARSLKRAGVWEAIRYDLEHAEDPHAWLDQVRRRKAPVAIVYWDELPEDWRRLITATIANMEKTDVSS